MMRLRTMAVMAPLAAVLALAAACGGDDNGGPSGAEPTGAVSNGTPSSGGENQSGTPVTVTVSEQTPIGEATTAAPSPTAGPPLNGSVVAIDANATTEAVDATATYAVGTEFKVAFVIESAGEAYQGYQFGVQRDPKVLAYVTVEHLKKANLTGCAPVTEEDGNRVAGGCLDLQTRDITETGAMATITFRCAAAGTSTLDLLTPQEILSSGRKGAGTKLVAKTAPDGLPLTINDATVTCS